MANHKSSKKRIRQTIKKQLFNKRIKSSLRTAEKQFRLTVQKQDKPTALKQFTLLSAAVSRAVTKGLFHKNTVNRKKSSLAALINKMS